MVSQLPQGHADEIGHRHRATHHDGQPTTDDSIVTGVPGSSSDLVDSRVRWIHFVLGCTVLVPWNVLITAMPFFLSRLAGSPFQETFSSYLSITYLSADFIFLAHATATSKSASHSRQIRTMTISLVFLILLLTMSTFVPVLPSTFFKFVLLVSVFAAANAAYLQSSVFAVASLFGPAALQAVMSGQAAVAVTVNFVQLISASVSLSQDPGTPTAAVMRRAPEEASAFAFFAFSTGFLGLSVLAHSMLVRMPAYQLLVAPVERKALAHLESTGERQALLAPPQEEQQAKQETATARIFRVAKTNAIYEVAVAYVFVITLAVFPPITTAIMPTNPGFHPLLFSAVHFLLFNLGDLFGRHLCSFPSLIIWSSHRLLALSLSRTLFIPIFLACNIILPSSPSHSTPLINSDILFFIILFAFGTSNGYVSSLCLMSAPSLEHNPGLRDKDDVDTAATIGVFCLVGGLVLGSMASFGIRGIICGCNPFVN